MTLFRTSFRPAPSNIILLIVAIGVCALLFFLLTWVSKTAAGQALDRQLLLSLQSVGEETFPRGPGWMREAGRDLTSLGSISVLLFTSLAVSGWLILGGRWRSMLVGVVCIVGGTLASFGLKLFFAQPRPDLVTSVTQTFTSSFPSSHAMASLITFVALAAIVAHGLESRTHQTYLLVMAILASMISGISRVYLGVHWPSDVLAGWVAGAAWLLLVALMVRLWLARWLAAELDQDRAL
jgi:undecaprenyl-diphosphatase